MPLDANGIIAITTLGAGLIRDILKQVNEHRAAAGQPPLTAQELHDSTEAILKETENIQ